MVTDKVTSRKAKREEKGVYKEGRGKIPVQKFGEDGQGGP
jgi:hypothetical protein